MAAEATSAQAPASEVSKQPKQLVPSTDTAPWNPATQPMLTDMYQVRMASTCQSAVPATSFIMRQADLHGLCVLEGRPPPGLLCVRHVLPEKPISRRIHDFCWFGGGMADSPRTRCMLATQLASRLNRAWRSFKHSSSRHQI